MKKKIINIDLILIAIFVSIIIAALQITKNWGIAERLALVSIIVAIAVGVIYMINSLLKEVPKFEVSNPRVETERVVDRVSRVSIAKTEKHEVETKTVYIDVKNKNPDADLTDCKIGIATKMGDWDTMNLENLIPDISQTIHLFRFFPNSSVVFLFESKTGAKLDVGKVHNLNIRFFGGKFTSKKIWHMELNLTSWDNCGLRFKTRRDMLKEKIERRRR